MCRCLPAGENPARPVRSHVRGRSVLIRYADDLVAGFETESDARRFLAALEKRLERFHLKLSPAKTRLLDFGRNSEATFTFLGFCHYWGKSLAGHSVVKRRTARERVARFIRGVHEWCRASRHQPLRWQHDRLSAKLRGHYGYYGVRTNMRALERVREAVRQSWRKWLCSRSQSSRMGWDRWSNRMQHLKLPAPRIMIPWA